MSESIEIRRSFCDPDVFLVASVDGLYIQPDGTEGPYCVYSTKEEAEAARDKYRDDLARHRLETIESVIGDERKPLYESNAKPFCDDNHKVIHSDPSSQIKVSKSDYMSLSNAYDEHSRRLMEEKGEEYSVDDDFLCMENRLAGMTGCSPEEVSLVMAGKHVAALTIILDKNAAEKISLSKLDERIRDACNLLKITAAFIHAKQSDFTLHL